jgi:tetratricopeptide (TPR) repeat protein
LDELRGNLPTQLERLVRMNVRASALGLALLLAPTAHALAEGASSKTAPAAPSPNAAATSTAAATPSKAIRRDPAGRTGISPSWEAIKRGDDAYVGHNVEGAIHEYQAAIESQPQNPVAHYRLACALIAKGDFKQAQDALDAALRFSQSDPQTAAKTLFVTADLKERQNDYPAALAAWKAYSAFIAAHAGVRAFPGSSDSRQAKIAAYMKLTEQSAKVKQRIDEREQLVEPEAQKDGKNPKKEDAKSPKK